MEVSQAEHSAGQFGVKLRRVAENEEKLVQSGRKSLPCGASTRCDMKLVQRRPVSSAPVIHSRSDARSSQVALRQEAAERQAIERQKRMSADRMSRVGNNRSWEKKTKPPLPLKPNLRSSVSVTSLSTKSNITSSTCKASSPKKSSSLGDLSRSNPVDGTKSNSLNISSWYNLFQRDCRPVIDRFYKWAKDELHKQTTCIVNFYHEYQKEFEKESRRCRNMRLTRKFAHGHRFLSVGIRVPSWCDLCAGTLWGKSNICLQCMGSDYESSRSSDVDLSTQKPTGKHTNRNTQDSGVNTMSSLPTTSSVTQQRPRYPNEDESDYACLWDSESGASGGSFEANGGVMDYLLRSKVHQNDPERRKAFLNTSSDEEELDYNSLMKENIPFDQAKFASLKAKVDNMDLQLTDFEFFTDLKHSPSLLELSKIFKSTTGLSGTSTSNSNVTDCKFTCHQSCEDLISGQCSGPQNQTEHDSSCKSHDNNSQTMDDTDSGYSGTPPGGSAGFTLTKEEIFCKIKAYNEKIGLTSSSAITLPSDDSDVFQGNIQVCINIDRPINMSLSSRPASLYDALQRSTESSPPDSPESTVSPELLPKNAVLSLHTSSENTSSDVVRIILKKFKITDNPHSFALFEQTIEGDKEVKLRKIGDQERPLLNFLRWSTECRETKRFVLKENDSGEIMYEAFSLPELDNFLRMLDKEESLFLSEIQNKYIVRRKQMEQRLKELEEERNKSHRSSSKHLN